MLAAWLLACAPIVAADAVPENAVRAAMVFNFLKFADWPAAAIGGPLTVCVATADPDLLAAMSALRERQVRGMPLAVGRFPQQADCAVIYVDSRQRWSGVLDSRRLAPATLTIGGYPGFAADGGMIEIAIEEGKARFDINLREARHAGVRFYPQLLRLARRLVE